jgi:hypothetical protein
MLRKNLQNRKKRENVADSWRVDIIFEICYSDFQRKQKVNAMMRRSTYFLKAEREDGWCKSLFQGYGSSL